MFPSYFLIIPIMCSGVIGASSFVGEKEHKTLESLLYTPISMEQLLRAKILGVFVPSYIVTLISFIVFGIIFNVGGFIYLENLFSRCKLAYNHTLDFPCNQSIILNIYCDGIGKIRNLPRSTASKRPSCHSIDYYISGSNDRCAFA